MKYITLALSIAVVLLPMSSEAGCADYYSTVGPGPNYGCPNAYYTFDTTCASTSNTADSTLSYCNKAGHQMDFGSGSIDYSMTVPSGHGSSCKDIYIYVDFSHSGDSQDAMSATAIVRHNGTVTYADAFFFRDGTQSELTCNLFDSGTFSASDGDTIELSITFTNRSGATMKVATPIFWD